MTPDRLKQTENLSELSRYAYGFSDVKPGWTYWLILGVIAAGAVVGLLTA